MRNAEPLDGSLQGLDDLARTDAVPGHYVVERKSADVFLERGRSPGIDNLDAKRPRRPDGPTDIVVDHRCRGAVADHRKQKVVIAEDCKRRLVDNRDIGEFEMGVQRASRRHRRFDDRSEPHFGVEAAGLEGRPASVGKRGRSRARRMGRVLFGQKQARRVHVAATDMGVDVDGAGHDDATGGVDGRVRLPAGGSVDDLAIRIQRSPTPRRPLTGSMMSPPVIRVSMAVRTPPRWLGDHAQAPTPPRAAPRLRLPQQPSAFPCACNRRRVMVDAGFADRDGDRRADDWRAGLRQRDQPGAVASGRQDGSPRRRSADEDQLRRPRACGRHRNARDRIREHRAQSRCACGKPVIQVGSKRAAPTTFACGQMQRGGARFPVEIGDQPLQHLERQAVGCRGRRTGRPETAQSPSALAKRSKIRHRRRHLPTATAARSAASVAARPASPQDRRVALLLPGCRDAPGLPSPIRKK